MRLEPNATFNGTFTFAGTETGSDFADFLLGVPSNYIQSSGGIFYLRNQYGGVFAQDSWRARSNLTINYGLRWDIMAPWYEKDNQIQTIVPGPAVGGVSGRAAGPRVSGRRGHVARAVADALRQRLAARRRRVRAEREDERARELRALLHAFQGLSAGIMYGVPPYGYNYLSPAPPLFETPFITAADGTNNGQRFPQQFPPLDASPSNPVTNIDWSQFLPVNADPYLRHDNKTPYSANFMFSIQRELAPNMVATASYVGTRGHNILVVQQTNPGDPALCLSVSQESQVAPGSATCGPFAENGVFTTADGTVINGTRTVLGPNYGSVTEQTTIGYSRYNALELNLRYTQGPASILAGYTLQQVGGRRVESRRTGQPVRRRAVRSAVGVRHAPQLRRQLQLRAAVRAAGSTRTISWTAGWSLSGTTRFSSGFPVTLYNPTDTSLLGTFGNGVNNNLLDTPNYTPGCDLKINHDPAKGPAFNTDCFSLPALGQLGNAPRRFFYGPGIENFDLALIKSVDVRQDARARDPPRGVQRVQPPAVLRRRRGGRQHRQPDVRRDRGRGGAAVHPARGQVHVLRAGRGDVHRIGWRMIVRVFARVEGD